MKATCLTTECPANSRCVDLYPAICRCDVGYVHHGDTCSNTRLLTLTNLSLDQPFYQSYTDTTSRDFLRLAGAIEKRMMEYPSLDGNVIKGTLDIKVLGI